MLVFTEVRLFIPTAARGGLHLSLTILVWGMLWFVFFRIEVDHSFTQVAASVSLIYTAEDSACNYSFVLVFSTSSRYSS